MFFWYFSHSNNDDDDDDDDVDGFLVVFPVPCSLPSPPSTIGLLIRILGGGAVMGAGLKMTMMLLRRWWWWWCWFEDDEKEDVWQSMTMSNLRFQVVRPLPLLSMICLTRRWLRAKEILTQLSHNSSECRPPQILAVGVWMWWHITVAHGQTITSLGRLVVVLQFAVQSILRVGKLFISVTYKRNGYTHNGVMAEKQQIDNRWWDNRLLVSRK